MKSVGARIAFQLPCFGIKGYQSPVRGDPDPVVFRDDPLNDLAGQRQGVMANETALFIITAKSVTVGSDPQPVRAVDGKRADRIAADRRRVVGIVSVVLQEVGASIVGVETVFVRCDPKTARMVLRDVRNTHLGIARHKTISKSIVIKKPHGSSGPNAAAAAPEEDEDT